MVDLKERFRGLDRVPAPDLEKAIALRSRHYASIPGARGAVDPGKTSGGFRLRPAQIVAVALVLLLAIGVAAIYYGRTEPVRHKPSPQFGSGSGYVSGTAEIHMASDLQGWATLDGLVYHTNDGGMHWTDVTPADSRRSNLAPPSTGQTVAFADASAAWILSYSFPTPSDHTIAVRRTLDGGKNWHVITSVQIVPWYTGLVTGRMPTFVDRTHGWVEVDLLGGSPPSLTGVVVYRTTDGGVHWDEVSVSTQFGTHSTSNALPVHCGTALTFVDAAHGWTGGNCSTALSLYVTRDGGQSWAEQELPSATDVPAAGAQAQGYVGRVNFSSPRDATVIASQNVSSLLLYATHDAGVTWTRVPLPGINLTPQSLALLSSSRGWLAGTNQLYTTVDGGRNWIVVGKDLGQATISDVQFVNDRRGWIMATGYCVLTQCWPAGGQTLLKTTDGGQTWTVQLKTAPYTIESAAIVFSDSGCSYQGPDHISATELDIRLSNATADTVRFDLWKLNAGHGPSELKAYFDAQQERFKAGGGPLSDPDFALRIRTVTVESGWPGGTSILADGGTYMVSCSRPADKPTTLSVAASVKA